MVSRKTSCKGVLLLLLLQLLLLFVQESSASQGIVDANLFGYAVDVCVDPTDAATAAWCTYIDVPEDALTDTTSSTTDDSFTNLTLLDGVTLPFFHEPLFPGANGVTMSGTSNGYLTPAGSTYSPFFDPAVLGPPRVGWPMVSLYTADLFPPGALNNSSAVRYWYTTTGGGGGKPPLAKNASAITSVVWNFDNVPLFGADGSMPNLTAQAQLFTNGTIIFRYKTVPVLGILEANVRVMVGLAFSDGVQFRLDPPRRAADAERLTTYGYRMERSTFDGCSSPTSCSSCVSRGCSFCRWNESWSFCETAATAAAICMPGKWSDSSGGCDVPPMSTRPYNVTLHGSDAIPHYVAAAPHALAHDVPDGGSFELPAVFPAQGSTGGIVKLVRARLENATVRLLKEAWSSSVVPSTDLVLAPLYQLASPGGGELLPLRPNRTSVQTINHTAASIFCPPRSGGMADGGHNLSTGCQSTLVAFWNISRSTGETLYSYAVEFGGSGSVAFYYVASATVAQLQHLSYVYAASPAFAAGLLGEPALLPSPIPGVPLLPGRAVSIQPLLPVQPACPVCYNGGFCNARHTGCLCPAPFTGPRCEVGCSSKPYDCALCNSQTSYCTCTGCRCREGYPNADCTLVAPTPGPRGARIFQSTHLFAAAAVIYSFVILLPLILLVQKLRLCEKEGSPNTLTEEGPQILLSRALPGPTPLCPIDDAALHTALFPPESRSMPAGGDASNSSVDRWPSSPATRLARARREVCAATITDKDYDLL